MCHTNKTRQNPLKHHKTAFLVGGGATIFGTRLSGGGVQRFMTLGLGGGSNPLAKLFEQCMTVFTWMLSAGCNLHACWQAGQ